MFGKPIWGIVKRVLLKKNDIEGLLLTIKKQGRHNIKYELSFHSYARASLRLQEGSFS